MDELQFGQALTEVWKLVGDANRYIDLTQPWVLGKSEETLPRLRTVLYNLAECVRAVAVLIAPTMPATPGKIFEQLGVADPALKTWESVKVFGMLKPGTTVKKGEALFPRLDVKKELAEIAAEKEASAPAKPEPVKEAEPAKEAEPRAGNRHRGFPQGQAHRCQGNRLREGRKIRQAFEIHPRRGRRKDAYRALRHREVVFSRRDARKDRRSGREPRPAQDARHPLRGHAPLRRGRGGQFEASHRRGRDRAGFGNRLSKNGGPRARTPASFTRRDE